MCYELLNESMCGHNFIVKHFSKCDSVSENDKGAGFFGCCVLLLIEITIGERNSFHGEFCPRGKVQ